MPKYQASLSRVAQLEKAYEDAVERTHLLLEKLRHVRRMLRHLRVDIDQQNHTDPEWLQEFDATVNAAWDACTATAQEIRAQRAQKGSEPLIGPVLDVVKAAREVAQADHACILGRAGCEQRWDRAMEELKQAVIRVKD